MLIIFFLNRKISPCGGALFCMASAEKAEFLWSHEQSKIFKIYGNYSRSTEITEANSRNRNPLLHALYYHYYGIKCKVIYAWNHLNAAHNDSALPSTSVALSFLTDISQPKCNNSIMNMKKETAYPNVLTLGNFLHSKLEPFPLQVSFKNMIRNIVSSKNNK